MYKHVHICIHIYIYIYIHDLATMNIRRKLMPNVYWTIPVQIHRTSDNPLEHTTSNYVLVMCIYIYIYIRIMCMCISLSLYIYTER